MIKSENILTKKENCIKNNIDSIEETTNKLEGFYYYKYIPSFICKPEKYITIKKLLISPCKFIYKRIEGGCWGFSEGVASGALTGLSTTGAGGLFFGLCGQIVAAVAGPVIGAFAGVICGVLSDKQTVMDLFKNYRENFGTHNSLRYKYPSL